MSTLGNFVELTAQKGMIRHILKTSAMELSPEELDEMVTLIQKKLLQMTVYRDRLRDKEAEALDKISEDYDADSEAVLDSYVYFSLIVENVWLKKKMDLP